MKNIRAFELYSYLSKQKFSKSQEDILQHLNISKSTFDRAKKYLREVCKITILSPSNGGYRLLDNEKNMLDVGNSLIHLDDLVELLRMVKLLEPVHQKNSVPYISDCVFSRLLGVLPKEYTDKLDFVDCFSNGERRQNKDGFALILESFKQNVQINIYYDSRSSTHLNKERQISPQRLIYYRSNWYLIAYCHRNNSLRIFSLDRIEQIKLLEDMVYALEAEKVDAYYKQTYGIFSGEKVETAHLKFYPPQSYWVKDESWHSDQILQLNQDGSCELQIPIGDNLTELVMVLAYYGDKVEVVKPTRLAQELIDYHKKSFEFQHDKFNG